MAAAETRRQALLQVLLSRRFCTRSEAHDAYLVLTEELEESLPDEFDRDVDALSTALAPLGLELRACHDPAHGTPYLALINAKADSLSEIATPYSTTELLYIRSLIDAIFTAPAARFAVPSTRALQIASHMQPTPLTKHAATELLRNLELRGWLRLSRTTGAYALTVRALCELDTYLRTEFEDAVLECMSCYALVTLGSQCATDGCRGAVHTACEDAYRAGHSACALCGAEWHMVPVGDTAPSAETNTYT